MRRSFATVLALAIAAALATPALAVSVKSDYDRAYDMTRLKTYAWAKIDRDPTDPLAQNEMLDRRLRAAIDEELAKKGFAKAASGTPDFYLAYYASIEEQTQVTTVGYAVPGWYGYGGYYGGYYGGAVVSTGQVYTYKQGTVIVDVIDASANQMVWRAHATATVDPGKSEKNIRSGAEKIARLLRYDIEEVRKAQEKAAKKKAKEEAKQKK